MMQGGDYFPDDYWPAYWPSGYWPTFGGSGPSVAGPYNVEAAQVYTAGAVIGEVDQ